MGKEPLSPADLVGLGLAAHQSGSLEEAEARYCEALEREPQNADALHLLGVLLHQLGRSLPGVDYLARAIAARDCANYRNSMGVVLSDIGRLADAETHLSAAIAMDPLAPGPHYNLGNARERAGRLAEAETGYRAALALAPDHSDALTNLGHVLNRLDRSEEAAALLTRALELQPASASALNNLGIALAALGRWGEAERAYRESLRLAPEMARAHNNLGVVLADLDRPEEAQERYREALRLDPGFAEAHSNLGRSLLLSGRFDEGWREHEWRWSTVQMAGGRRDFAAPLWLGGLTTGGALLLHAEQGLGDTLQFSRYAPLVTEAEVVLEVQPSLVRLLAGSFPSLKVIARGDPLPAIAAHCPLLTLPMVFQTNLATIPGGVPYLRADPAASEGWRRRLASLEGLKVGLVWAGGRREETPELAPVDRRRSISLATLAPLAEVAGVSWISLQKGPPSQEAESARFDLRDDTAELHDFADTAALVNALDLVISVDTAVIHLAGGLAKPVWLLNRYDTCWRWLRGRNDSPWYPTLRQFRQQKPGEWGPVIASVREALTSFAATRRGAATGGA